MSLIITPQQAFSSFGVVTEAENLLLASRHEDAQILKSRIHDRQAVLKDYREDRIENMKKHMDALTSGHAGCLKFIKIVTLVGSAVSAPLTMGGSLGASMAITSAARIATAVLSAVSALTSGLEQLDNAARQKRILLTKADEQHILMLIQEAERWMTQEQEEFRGLSQQTARDFESHQESLKLLEDSFVHLDVR